MLIIKILLPLFIFIFAINLHSNAAVTLPPGIELSPLNTSAPADDCTAKIEKVVTDPWTVCTVDFYNRLSNTLTAYHALTAKTKEKEGCDFCTGLEFLSLTTHIQDLLQTCHEMLTQQKSIITVYQQFFTAMDVLKKETLDEQQQDTYNQILEMLQKPYPKAAIAYTKEPMHQGQA